MCLGVRARCPVYKSESSNTSSPHEGKHLYASIPPLANIISRLFEAPRRNRTHPTFHFTLLPICLSNSHLPSPVSFSPAYTLLSYFLRTLQMGSPHTRLDSANQVLGLQPTTVYPLRGSNITSHYFILAPPLSPTVLHRFLCEIAEGM